ncbi:MAG: hypothetical protein JKY61_06075 [Planctomycetes bacterium]|nr:hypothetical protein [Planctomycetota bacterium]
MAAVQSTSKVLYANAPDDPHSLRVTLADRGFARLKLASDPEVQGRRVLQHLHNGVVFATSARASESVEIKEADALTTRNWFDLRAALHSWQNGKNWDADPAQPHRRTLPLGRDSSIHAEIDPETGLPSSMGFYDEEGIGLQRFTKLTWSDEGLNSKILTFQVETAQGVLWQESDIQIRRGLSMRADFFLPTDRRPKSNLPITTHPAGK